MTGERPGSDSRCFGIVDERVEELSASAKVVVLVLQQSDGDLTRSQLRSRTALPSRTLSRALRDLRQEGVIERSVSPDDARNCTYTLSPGDSTRPSP